MTAAPTLPATVEHGAAEADLGVIVLAFAADPAARWWFPEAGTYLRAFPELVRDAGAGAFAAGTVDRAAGLAGVAVWVPPASAAPDGDVDGPFGWAVDADRHEVVRTFNAAVTAHQPTEPHWHLLCIGVDPRLQGRGHGSALLRRGLARCDRDGLPAYLETANPRTRGLYERHGFDVVGTVQVADSPPVWSMLRRGSRDP